MKTIRTKPTNGATQVRYIGEPIQGYLLSLWTDGKYRLANPVTGNLARCFGSMAEVEEYRRELAKRPTPDFVSCGRESGRFNVPKSP